MVAVELILTYSELPRRLTTVLLQPASAGASTAALAPVEHCEARRCIRLLPAQSAPPRANLEEFFIFFRGSRPM